jgi:hypothetical protein
MRLMIVIPSNPITQFLPCERLPPGEADAPELKNELSSLSQSLSNVSQPASAKTATAAIGNIKSCHTPNLDTGLISCVAARSQASARLASPRSGGLTGSGTGLN